MSNLKRLLALVFAVLMIVGNIPAYANNFSDVEGLTEEESYAINLLSDLSIILGREDGSFGPDDEVSRMEMAILAARLQTGEPFGSSYGENVTPFGDVHSNFEAILYAANMGIIAGDDRGNFNPDNKVIYQDVLTMIVRTLGYMGEEMDANYPFSYIIKAKELGIIDEVSLKNGESVKRKDVAVLLSNALFAEKADGSTAARDAFGVDTYVVTAAFDQNMTGVMAYLANNTRVVVQPLNEDGSINDMFYHIPVSAFREEGYVPTVGASYRIASVDNLETVKAIRACPSAKMYAGGEEVTLTPTGKVILPDASGKRVSYRAVDRYTRVYNTQGTHTDEKEIIVYNVSMRTVGVAEYWFTTNLEKIPYLNIDSSGNILGAGGKIIAYYSADSYDHPYFIFDSDNKTVIYVNEEYVWENAVLLDYIVSRPGKEVTLLTDAFGNIIDYDGYIIAYYIPGMVNSIDDYPYFGYDEATDSYYPVTEEYVWEHAVQVQDNNTHYIRWTHDELDSEGMLIDPESNLVLSNKDVFYSAIAYDDDFDGDYDRLFYQPNGMMFDRSSTTAVLGLSYISGLVTNVDDDGITIDGERYAYSSPYVSRSYKDYSGMYVNAQVYENSVYSISGRSGSSVIFDRFVGWTQSGKRVASVYTTLGGSPHLVVVASVDGYYFAKNDYTIPTNSDVVNYQSPYDDIHPKWCYSATVDAYGYYHLSTHGAYKASITNSLPTVTAGTLSTEQTDVVYLTKKAAEEYTVDKAVLNITGAGEEIVGFRYVYHGKAFSLLSGEYVSICTNGIYNYRLEEGFYVVHNGVVDRRIENLSEDAGCPIAAGKLVQMSNDTLKIEEIAGSTGGATDTVYYKENVDARIHTLNVGPDSFLSGGSWSSLSSYRSNHNISGPVIVFYYKSSLYSHKPILIAITDKTGEGAQRWLEWGGK